MAHTRIVKITNSYHNTTARARALRLDIDELYLSAGQVRRIRRELCGHTGCLCGGDLGECGPQAYDINIDFGRHGRLLGAFLAQH